MNDRKQSIEYWKQQEATASLMEQQAARYKDFCQRQRRKLEGVSTPSVRKGHRVVSEEEIAKVLSRRERFISNKTGQA
jgi:hypothetical protein